MDKRQSKKFKTVLIGAGQISLEYQKGLNDSDYIDLRAIVDIDKNAIGFNVFPNTRRFFGVDELSSEDVDLAIVSTPPATHFDIIKKCLKKGWNVIVEKPFSLTMDSVIEAYEIAKDSGVFLNTSYHWQNGEEVKTFNKLYDPKLIKRIDITVNDPYSVNGTSINTEKVCLAGAWIDSGVNALSLIKTWLPFNETKVVSVDTAFADNVSLPIYCKAELEIDGVPATITVDWTNGINSKKTRLLYHDREILINHSEQAIVDGETVHNCNTMPRLTRHYYNYFTRLRLDGNYSETVAIHRLLFKVKDTYDKKIHS